MGKRDVMHMVRKRIYNLQGALPLANGGEEVISALEALAAAIETIFSGYYRDRHIRHNAAVILAGMAAQDGLAVESVERGLSVKAALAHAIDIEDAEIPQRSEAHAHAEGGDAT